MCSERNGILIIIFLIIISAYRAQSQNLETMIAENTIAQQTKSKKVQSETGSSEMTVRKSDNRLLKGGIGIQCGIRFHRPEEFNDFVTDLWNSILAERMYTPVDKKKIGPGLFLTLNGAFDIGGYFQAAPFAQGMWAGKQFRFRGGILEDLNVNTLTAMGGLNLWVRVLNNNRYTIRFGAGGYGAYTIAYIKCDESKTRLSGSGYGVKGLLGTELRLNSNMVITLDFSIPWGTSEFKYRENELEYKVEYPDRFKHLGFEIVPGIMFYF